MRDGTDEYWVGRASRDPEAFGELVSRYQDRIFGVAVRLVGDREVAADIAQDTFLRAYRSLKSFRPDARFAPWIYKIAVNLCLDERRVRAVRPVAELDDDLVDREPTPERQTETLELRRELLSAIDALPPKYRAAVVLRHIQDLPYEDIAEALGVPLGTVKTWLFRGRELLQTRLAPIRSERHA